MPARISATMRNQFRLTLKSVILLITVVSYNEQFSMFRFLKIHSPYDGQQIYLMYGCKHRTLSLSMKEELTLTTFDLRLKKHFYVQGSRCTMYIKPIPPADGFIIAYEKFETRQGLDNLTLDLDLYVEEASGVHTHRVFYAYRTGFEFSWKAGVRKNTDHYVKDLGFRIIVTPYIRNIAPGTFKCDTPVYERCFIDHSFTCNARNNCGDGSDERDCDNLAFHLTIGSALMAVGMIFGIMGLLLLDGFLKWLYYKLRLKLVTARERYPVLYEEFQLAARGLYLPQQNQFVEEVQREEQDPQIAAADERLKQVEARLRLQRPHQKLVRLHAQSNFPHIEGATLRQSQEDHSEEELVEHEYSSQSQEIVIYERQQRDQQQPRKGVLSQRLPEIPNESPLQMQYQRPPGIHSGPPLQVRYQRPPGPRYEPPPDVQYQSQQGIQHQSLQEIQYQPHQELQYQSQPKDIQQQAQNLPQTISVYTHGSQGSLSIENLSSPQPGPSGMQREMQSPDEFYWSSSS